MWCELRVGETGAHETAPPPKTQNLCLFTTIGRQKNSMWSYCRAPQVSCWNILLATGSSCDLHMYPRIHPTAHPVAMASYFPFGIWRPMICKYACSILIHNNFRRQKMRNNNKTLLPTRWAKCTDNGHARYYYFMIIKMFIQYTLRISAENKIKLRADTIEMCIAARCTVNKCEKAHRALIELFYFNFVKYDFHSTVQAWI